MKPLVLFFPFDLLSHTLRCLSLAKAIDQEVDILFPDSQKYSQFITDAGFLTFAYQGPAVDLVMQSAKKFNFDWIQKDLLEEQFLEQVHIIQTLKPKAVIGDANFTLRMAAAYTHTPFISIVNGYMSSYYQSQRRLPPSHLISRLFAFLPKGVFASISKRAEKYVFRRVHQPFRKLSAKYKISFKPNLLGELEGDMTWIADIPFLFPQRKLPTTYHFIGPLFHYNTVANTAVEQWMQNGKKTILVTVGSSGDIHAFRFLLENEFKKFNILVVGDTYNQFSGDHVLSFSFLEVGSLLKDISLMICHGGNGSLYQALQAGIPILCHPSNFEQEWNLQGLEKSGCGERLSLNPTQRVQQIQHWMTRKGTDSSNHLSRLVLEANAIEKFKILFVQFFKN